MGLKSQIVGDRIFFTDGEHLFQPDVNFLVVVVGQACNFKCRDCANFCPHMPKELWRYNVESIMKNIAIVLKAVTSVNRLQLQGGEPFLYSDLDRLIAFIRACDKIRVLVIATNGSIVPSDMLMNVLQKNDVKIRISNYGLYPQKLEALEKKCEQFGLDYYTYNFASKKALWYDSGGINNFIIPPPCKNKRICRADISDVQIQKLFNAR